MGERISEIRKEREVGEAFYKEEIYHKTVHQKYGKKCDKETSYN